MKIPLRISTRKLNLSQPALDSIKNKAEKLEQFYDKIIACRVVVERPHRHKNHGALYHVSIDLSLPGAELAVKRESNEDVYIAIRDAFDVARRQLLSYNHKRKDKNNKQMLVNLHEPEVEDLDYVDEDFYGETAYELGAEVY